MDKSLSIDHYIDLCGLSCPINFVKCCLALEKLSSNQVLKVDIDIGESEASVTDGLREKGYQVKILNKNLKKVTLIIFSEKK